MSFFPATSLDTAEAEAIARGLYAVSRRDGVHEREAALIASFWADSGGGAVALAELERQPDITGEQLANLLYGPDKRQLFLKTAILLAWADGNASDSEMALINDFAKALGFREADVKGFAAEVKEYLLSHLTHLQNSASAASVAKKLNVLGARAAPPRGGRSGGAGRGVAMSLNQRRGASARQVGKYRLLMPLGSGGMATVHLALALGPRDVTQLVVVKVPRGDFAFDPEHRARFLDEARVAARLCHPHLVQTGDAFEHEGVPHLVMEHLEGQTLRRLTRWASENAPERSLPHRLRALADALSGLHHAHELCDFDGTPLQIVHRDVAPENVFVTYEGRVKVVDFGIAKAVGARHRTQAGAINGRIAYMAPEQLAGEGLDRRADVFSVGAMLWEDLTGRPLWGELPLGEIARRLLRLEVPRPRDERAIARTPLLRVCERALAPLAADRYETADQMRRDLEAVLRAWGQPVSYDELGALVGEAFERERATRRRRIDQLLARFDLSRGPAAKGAAPPPAAPAAPPDPGDDLAPTPPRPAVSPRVGDSGSRLPPPRVGDSGSRLPPPPVAPPAGAPVDDEDIPTRPTLQPPLSAAIESEELVPTRPLHAPPPAAAGEELIPTRLIAPPAPRPLEGGAACAPPSGDDLAPTPQLASPSPAAAREGLASPSPAAAREGLASPPPATVAGREGAAQPSPAWGGDAVAFPGPLEAPPADRRPSVAPVAADAPKAADDTRGSGPSKAARAHLAPTLSSAPPPESPAGAPRRDARAGGGGPRLGRPTFTINALTLASLLFGALLAGVLLSRYFASPAGAPAEPPEAAAPFAPEGGAARASASPAPARAPADAKALRDAAPATIVVPPLVQPHSLPPAPRLTPTARATSASGPAPHASRPTAAKGQGH